MSSIEELGKMMDSQMKRVFNANHGITVELGTIGSNLSLSVASLGNSIPKGDYMISLHLQDSKLELETSSKELKTNVVELTTSTTEEHIHTIDRHSHNIDSHDHKVTLPNRLRGLKAGDRVIVAWVGTEPIVIDVVVSS